MRYNKKILAYIGRMAVQKDKHWAAQVAEQMPVPMHRDLTAISKLYKAYCSLQEINPMQLYGSVRLRGLSEQKKLFVGAMVRVYYGVTGMQTEVSTLLGQQLPSINRMVKEDEVRYRCDKTYKEKVDQIVTHIKPLIQ